MNREIKFRAWDNVEKEWVRAFSIPNIGWQKIEGEPMTDLEIMQYTGLKDKNGKEIYEGDILSYSTDAISPLIVKWNDDRAQFMAHGYQFAGHKTFRHGLGRGKVRCEVIGNIYETPDLLKEN